MHHFMKVFLFLVSHPEENWPRVKSLWRQITQHCSRCSGLYCIAARKVAHWVCKGSGILWYGYTLGLLEKLVQPFLWDHKMTDDGWITSTVSFCFGGLLYFYQMWSRFQSFLQWLQTRYVTAKLPGTTNKK